jgi:hypothetical protein
MLLAIVLLALFILWCLWSGYTLGWPMIVVNGVLGWFLGEFLATII